MMQEDKLRIFLVAPKGYEGLSSVIVAENEEKAKIKMLYREHVKRIVEKEGVPLVSLNLTSYFDGVGFDIEITKKPTLNGIYH